MICKTLSSGVSCRFFPQKGFVEKQAMAVVRFGSDTGGFSLGGRHYTVPAGTAHFIEHTCKVQREQDFTKTLQIKMMKTVRNRQVEYR